MLAPILDIKNLSVFSNESPLLQNISFSLKKYSILGIIGESGSGKSLTALSILNILKHKGLKQIGDIIYNEDNITSYDSNQFRDFLKKDIGIIFQDPSSYLNPSMKCGDQMLEVLNQKSSEEFLSEILKKVKFSNPKEILNRYPHELSGGQKQRIMIAMMIAKNSKIIICDEATSSLDALIKKEIIELLLDLKKEFELSMIFISHNLKLIHKICDEVVFLKNGKLVEKGNTTDVFKSPKSNYTKNLIKLNFKPIVKKSKNEPSNINLLKIEKLNLEINNLKILSEINFNLKRNEILGIIGESGSGKTSIARCILNIYRNYIKTIYHTNNKCDAWAACWLCTHICIFYLTKTKKMLFCNKKKKKRTSNQPICIKVTLICMVTNLYDPGPNSLFFVLNNQLFVHNRVHLTNMFFENFFQFDTSYIFICYHNVCV